MLRQSNVKLACAAALLSIAATAGAATNDPALLAAMETELQRAFAAFSTNTPPLYYFACGVTDTETLTVRSSFGALISDSLSRNRLLDVDARCGSYARDNTHPLPGYMASYREEYREVPLDDDPVAVRMVLWRALDSEYRAAAERFAQVQAMDITKASLRDKSDDFAKAEPAQMSEPRSCFAADRQAWRERITRYTEPLRKYPNVYHAAAYLHAAAATRTFVSSEGVKLQFGRTGYYLSIRVDTRSDDGLDLPLYESFFSWEPGGLPSDERVLIAVTNLAETAEKLRNAPLVDPYCGPAILHGEAAAVFMHEVLGHRLEGHRQKDEKESQTFKAMVGKKVMPEFLSVIFDPGLRTYEGLQISGFYPFDEEGVRGQRVVNVEDGILRSFLMSRMPIEGFPESNGHGRAAPGMAAVSRQSNMIIKPSATRPAAGLRDMLREECRKQGKPYGLVFEKVEGGFTMTGRMVPNAFNVSPLVVYRVYTDDRPDELVRGVDIIGTPLTVLTKILAAGDDLNVFNGTCGAESGGVSVGAASPSLLLGEIEVQKKEISRASKPVLAAPEVGGGLSQ